MKKILSITLALLLLVSATCLTGCFDGLLKKDDGDKGSNNNATADKNTAKDEAVDALIQEVGGASETFVGALSEETYSSAEEAARAYIVGEVAGNKKTEIINTKSNGALSDKAIQKAGIPESLLAGADSVEELEVTYDEIDVTMDGISLLASTTKTVKVYVIKSGMNYQYFTPRPVNGDTITKTYYDSVFNYEKYQNCTFKNVQTVKYDISYSGNGESGTQASETKVEQLLKYAGNKIYLELTTTTYDSTTGAEPSVQTIAAYMEEVDGDVTCYVKQNGSDWMMGSLSAIGFSSLEELTPFYDQYLDYTYFTKTEYGFALGKENATSYIDEVLGGQFGDLLEQGMEFDMLAKYVVQEGVLSAVLSDATLDFNMSQDGMSASMKYVIKSEMTCTNYGTTVVEKPFTE